MKDGRAFDTVAALYDARRSGYPSQLFSDLVRLAELQIADRVLEIGCGSGQATAGLLAEGLDVTGVDPGEALINLAREKFANSPSARFVVSSFEDWPLDGAKFALVCAAQSWHWLRPEIAFAKAAEALRPGGHIAIFGHTPAWGDELASRLRPIYAELAPEAWGVPPEVWYLQQGPIANLITQSGLFEPPQHRLYSWRRTYSAAELAGYLGTRSDHLRLPRDRLDALLGAVASRLPQLIEADWVTNLYVAPRLTDASSDDAQQTNGSWRLMQGRA